MRRLFSLATSLMLYWLGAQAQDDRFVCDESCDPGIGGEHTFNQYLSHIISTEGGEETTTPVWYDTQAGTMTTVPTMEHGATAFLITGDASRNKVQTMPGGGFSTVSIDLPAAWDSLMAVMGYPALSDMLLTSTPGGGEGGSAAIKSASSPSKAGRPVRTEYYNMQGQRNPYRRGAYIRRDTYGNGPSQSQKQIGR